MNYVNQFEWVIFPYMMISLTIVGHVYRYLTDQMGWTTKSSEVLEKKALRWGSMLFHYGVLFVIGGHFIGLCIPKSFDLSIGISNEMYHHIAIYTGGVAGIVTLIGILILTGRRFFNKRVNLNSSFMDKLIVILLLTEILLGVYNTIFYNFTYGPYEYRTTISPWFRSLFIFAPDPKLMANIPFTFKLHVLLAFTIFGLWPFTRLVHVWSFPINFIRRTNMLYRRRCGDVQA